MKMTETITWIAVADQLPPKNADVQCWHARAGCWTPDAKWDGIRWRAWTDNGLGGMAYCWMEDQPTHWAEKPQGPKGE